MKPSHRAFLVLCVSLVAAFPLRAETELYDIAPAHSWVGFSVRHFFTQVPGFFGKVKGTFTVDRANLENSMADSVIDVASITTSAALRDEHLRSDKFFDAEKYPTMTFKSKTWKRSGNAEELFVVTGDLTIRDVTKEVVLKVKSLGFGPGMQGNPICGWELSTLLDRRDFGITAAQGPVGNEVDVRINIEAGLRTTAKIAK